MSEHKAEFDYEPLLVGTMRRHPTWHVQVIDAFLTGQKSGTTARTFVAEFEEAIRYAQAVALREAAEHTRQMPADPAKAAQWLRDRADALLNYPPGSQVPDA